MTRSSCASFLIDQKKGRIVNDEEIKHELVSKRPWRQWLDENLVDLDTLLRESDFVCVNCPLNEQTRRLVSTRQFSLMKATAFFINTARGPIVDEKALYQTLADRKIAGAAIDVFELV